MQPKTIPFDEAITLAAAAKLLPTNTSPATLYRWCAKGFRGIKLDHARFGSRIVTSERALEKFSAEIAAAEHGRQEDADLPGEEPTNDHVGLEAEADALGV